MSNPAALLIDKFGGARSLSRAIKLDHSGILRWRERATVPQRHYKRLLRIAKRRGIDLTLEDLAFGRRA